MTGTTSRIIRVGRRTCEGDLKRSSATKFWALTQRKGLGGNITKNFINANADIGRGREKVSNEQERNIYYMEHELEIKYKAWRQEYWTVTPRLMRRCMSILRRRATERLTIQWYHAILWWYYAILWGGSYCDAPKNARFRNSDHSIEIWMHMKTVLLNIRREQLYQYLASVKEKVSAMTDKKNISAMKLIHR